MKNCWQSLTRFGRALVLFGLVMGAFYVVEGITRLPERPDRTAVLIALGVSQPAVFLMVAMRRSTSDASKALCASIADRFFYAAGGAILVWCALFFFGGY